MISAHKMNIAGRELAGNLERRSGRKWTYLAAGTAGLIAILFLVHTCSTPEKPSGPPPRPVSVAKVITKDAPLYLDEIGNCAANESVQVQAQVSGQIVSRDFKDGADVKKGDLLFTIDQRPYQAALGQAQGQLAQANAQLALDQLNLKRQEDLRARNVISQQDFDTAEATAKSDEAKVQSAQAAVSATQVNLNFCEIRSPINGRAGLRQVDVGNTVTAGSNGGSGGAVLVQIDNLDPIYTDFTISEPDLPLVRQYLGGANLKVLTDAENDNIPAREGQLYFIANTLQPGTGTVQARAVTPNPDHLLWPSQFVHVRLILDIIKGAKLVPNGAVQVGQNGPYIFVVKKDSTLDLRQVKPGQKQSGDLTVIKQGVEPGETVVVRGQLQLAPGTKVIAKEEEQSPPQESGGNDADSTP
jgi:multidrug efflux system membrane fusion protein